MERKETVTVLMFGTLHRMRRQKGLPAALNMPIPAQGIRAAEIARELGLPGEALGIIYHNHRPAGLQQLIRPGDRLAFVPKSSLGPHNGPLGFPLFCGAAEPAKVAAG